MGDAAAQGRYQVRLETVRDHLAPEKMANAYRVLVPSARLFPAELTSPSYECIDCDLCPSLLRASERGEDHRESDLRTEGVCHAENYVVPESWVFEDEGYSGATLARPGLERLRDLVSEGQMEIVLVYSPDRLSRRYAYQVLRLEEFSRQGVEVRFLKGNAGQSPEEQLLVQFQGMIAEYERAQITERCRRGKRHRAKTGSVNVLSGAPYGYRYLKKTDSSESCYVIDENEVPVVRQVYQWYTEEGLSLGR